MESNTTETGSRDLPKSDETQHSKSEPQNKDLFEPRTEGQGFIFEFGDLLFGVDPQRSTLHRAARQEFRTHLINLKFYFECASTDIQQMLETLEKVDRYEGEHKKL